ncbi:Flagellar motor switch protein FliG [Novipirellula aureliae]|uniref:Flagellar motor switch protein FliG n=1 Tax=Novipirellula aureliae TaxID=2527966 RepID=A0A5C6ED94_9BACT|nr:FliG C-terminal domain-containing protein [Novipirellula aureliae]TWU45947.1 Flagellar motor switch protein FliG [Novipirellula aureliae]
MNVAQPPTASHSATADREANLRRVAIVLSSLPPSVSANLIGSIDAETKKLLRRAMTTLSDVDPLERQRALASFKGMVEHPASSSFEANPIDEVSFSNASASAQQSHVVKRSSPSTTASSNNSDSVANSPLAFLGDAEDDLLVKLLSEEHPQAAALVLASISPAQAARIIPRLDAAIQSDALGRIGRLGEVPEEAVEELAMHLKTRVEQMMQQQKRSSGQRALNAILAAMPKEQPESQKPSQPVNRLPIIVSESVDHSDVDDSKRHTEIHSLRVAPGTSVDPKPKVHAAKTSVRTTPSVLDSTDATHQYLTKLSARELCLGLGLVDTNQALLALCGLPKSVCDAAMKFLPRNQAKQVRSQMNSLTSIQLHEIDAAKAAVVHALHKNRETTKMAA